MQRVPGSTFRLCGLSMGTDACEGWGWMRNLVG